MYLWYVVKLAALALLLSVAAGCASTPSLPSESLLSAAGFKTIVASTPQQQQHLRWLHQDQVSEVQLTGKHYYVYPDVAKNQLYVGTPKEYQAYLALRSQSGLPNPEPANADASNMQQYLKRDAAMTKADAQDATIPSWAVWPEFGGLGWIP
jgi:hypothetical protein